MKSLRLLVLGLLAAVTVVQPFSGRSQSGVPSGPVAEVITPEIQALADGLQDDPVRILNYVHDHIRYVHYFGSEKGANLTLLEKSGNDFDQCALLVALLRAAGYTNSQFLDKGVGYQFGWMFMDYDSSDGRDLHHWLQLDLVNYYWIVTYYYLSDLFYARGYPVTYPLNDGNTYMFQRVWVTLTLGSKNYYLDPSFKISNPTYGITNLAAAMGVSSNALWTAAQGTDTGNYVTNVNEANLRSTLTGCTTNFLNYVQSNYPNASVQQIIGGWQILASTETALSTNTSFETYEWGGGLPIVNWQYQPTNMMTTLKISFAGTNYQWLFPKLQGQRVTLTFDASGLAQLWQDDSLLVQHATSGPGSTTNASLAINHPHGTWDLDYNVFIDSTNSDRAVTNSYQRTNATYAIFYGNDPDWGYLQKRQNQLAKYRQQGLPDTSREVVSETLNVMGLSWLVQNAATEQMLATQIRMLPHYVNNLGRMAQENGAGYYIDLCLQGNASYPSAGDDPVNWQWANVHFDLLAFFGSAFEHGIIEQMQNTNLLGASTVKMLEIANTNKQAVYLATSNNWTSIKSKFFNYDTATLNTVYTNYLLRNYSILMPQNGSNQVAGAGSWAGYGYMGLSTNSGTSTPMIISGGYHGGSVSISTATIPVSDIQKTGENQPTSFTQVGTSTANLTSGDPVDTANCTFLVEHNDLSIGQAEPRGITLSRYYNGTRRYSNPVGMAGGWIHNYAISANTVAAPQAGLGETTPAQAAPMIVATCAAINLFRTTPGAKNWLTTALISKWGIDQLIKNGATINLGKDTVQFIRQPNGTFTPPANTTMSLTQNGSAYSLQQRHGNTFKFDSLGRLTNIVDQYAAPLTVSYLSTTSSLPYQVTDWKNRTFTFNYTSGQLASVSDGTRTVNYGYSTAYSPQSDLTSFTDAENKTSTYQYDMNHQITATLDAQSRLVISNLYDSQGHITKQYTQGDTNKMWRFFWAGSSTVEYNPAGGINAYFYDDQGRLFITVNPLQNTSELVYDGQNHAIYTVSPLYAITHSFFDGRNNLVQQIDPLGFTNQFIYDANNNLIKVIDPRGNPTTFGYNSQFSLTGQTNGAGDYINYTYNSDGTLHTRTDSGGTTIYDSYDGYGQLTHITYPSSFGGETFVNNQFGDITSHIDANGNITTYGYNSRRQLTNTVAPGTLVSKIAYDVVGNIASMTDARDNAITNTWSVTRQLLATILPATPQGVPITTNTYDNRDWLTHTVDPLQSVTLYTNDALGQLISITDPVQRTTRLGYDADGRKLFAVNAANATNSQTWDARGSMLSTTDGAGHFATSTYDAAGNQIILTNRSGKKWQFQFDGANRLTNTISPKGYTSSLTFNHQGLPATITDQANQPTSLYYDAKGRLTNRTDNVATTYYGYDANDNRTSVTEGNKTNSWTVDAYNRASAYRDTDGNLIQYRYDANGNLTNLIYPGNRNVYYAYDSLNRMTNVSDWSGRQSSISYDLASHITRIKRPNGSYRTINYNAAGQATNILEQMANSLPIAVFKYCWTNSGNMAWEFAAPLPHAATVPTRNMAYDDDNRLFTVNGQNVVNDSDGNLTSGPLTNGTFATYVYDARNRLTSAGGIGNRYDAINNRISITNGTNLTSFVVNLNAKYPQVLMRIKNGVTNYYIYGAGLLYQITETATATNTLTYHYDYRGSTIAISAGNGIVTDRIEYAVYGLTTYRAGTTDTPFLFNGRYGVQTDPNGLLYMRARFYNPYLCRFISADPSGFAGGLNHYAFASGNPVSLLDPFGLNATATADTSFGWVKVPDELAPCIMCHGVSAGGFNGDVNSFSAYMPGSGPGARQGYAFYHGVSIDLTILAGTYMTGGLLSPAMAARMEMEVENAELSALRARHYTSSDGLDGIQATKTIFPSRGEPVGVHVEVGPDFGPAGTGAAETGAFGKGGAYVEFDAPAQIVPTYVGPRNTAVIPSTTPLDISKLNPTFTPKPWWKF